MLMFKPVSIDELKDKQKWVKNCKINEFGIVPTCLYAPYCKAEYAIYKDYFIIRYSEHNETIYSVSEAEDEASFVDAINKILQIATPLHLACVSTIQKQILEKHFTNIKIDTDPNQYDYIYLLEDFVKLSGNKARHKREHYKYFTTHYNYEITPLTNDNKNDCMPIMEGWCARKECNACEYCCERDVIYAMLDRLCDYPINGVILYVDNKPMAFFLYEAVGDTIMGYHQKTIDASIRGLSNTIYIDTLSSLVGKYKYFNFGPDIGIDGLRQFKRQFKPFEFVEKYNITIK